MVVPPRMGDHSLAFGLGLYIKSHVAIHDLLLQRCDMLVDRLHQALTAFTRQRGDLENRPQPTQSAHEIAHLGRTLFMRHHVQLVEHQPTWLFPQGLVIDAQLFNDGARLLHRIDVIEWRHIHHVQQHARALQVAQEQVAQACAF